MCGIPSDVVCKKILMTKFICTIYPLCHLQDFITVSVVLLPRTSGDYGEDYVKKVHLDGGWVQFCALSIQTFILFLQEITDFHHTF